MACDVLIIGAGPTGLTAGVELQRLGFSTRIIDKRDHASSFSRAVGIMPASVDILRPSGVADQLLKEGMRINRLRLFSGSRKSAELSVAPKNDSRRFLLCLAQDRTEFHLAAAYEKLGGQLSFEVCAQDITQSDNDVSVTTQNGDILTANFALGADGTRSVVRESLGLAYKGFDLPEEWSIADVDLEDFDAPDAFTAFRLGDGRIAVMAPIEPNRVRLISNTPDALETIPLDLKVSNIRRSGSFKISVRQVDRYDVGRIFLAGDAAHCHSPAGGRGMNLGIADAADFAARMKAGTLDGYTYARHEDGRKIITFTERGRKIMTSPDGILSWLVLKLVAGFSYFPAITHRLGRGVIGE